MDKNTIKRIVVTGLAVYGGVALVRDAKRFIEQRDRKENDKKSMFKQTHMLTITNRYWHRDYILEKYVTNTKTGWSVPSGAFDVQTEKRIRATKDIEIGDYVRVPISKEDLYYIYKVNEWVDLSPVHFSGSGEITDEDIKKMNDSLPTTPGFDPLVPKPDDIRLVSTHSTFYIEGYDENGKMQKIKVDGSLYAALLAATTMDYDTDFWGIKKNPRLHIEAETNETQDEVKENDTVESDDTKEK